MQEQRQRVVEQYLKTHFGQAEISTVRNEANDGLLCQIQDQDGERYQLIVMDESLQGNEDEMMGQLERYNPAQVLREVIGFPISVTANGCIVGC